MRSWGDLWYNKEIKIDYNKMKIGEDCSRCYSEGKEKCSCTDHKKKQHTTNKKRPHYSTAPSVVIKVKNNSPQSPHVVDLAKNSNHSDNKNRLDSIPVYSEKTINNHNAKKEVYNVAHVVKTTNQNLLIDKQKEVIKKQQQEIENLKNTSVKQVSNTKPKKTVQQKKPLKVITKKSNIPELLITPPEAPYKVSAKSSRITAPKKSHYKKPFKQKKSYNFFKFPEMPELPDFDFSVKKFLITTLTLAIVVGLPFPVIGYYKKVKNSQQEVVDQSTNAFYLLQSSTIAALQANLPVAQQGLQQALVGFSKAEDILNRDHKIITSIAELIPFVGTSLKSGEQILRSGQHLTLGNTYLIKGLSAASADESLHISDKLLIVKRHLQYAIPQYERALEEMSGVESRTLPVKYQDSFKDVKLLLATFVDDLKDIKDLTEAIHILFGGEEMKRYLVVFQNHHEIRPTGGFIGSFAIVDVQKGKIVNIEVPEGGSYDLQGQLDVHVTAPVPIQLVNGRWEFQDSNWFPDFPASARKMSWFYKHARGNTVDGVVAVNATVLERFLRVVGPVEVEGDYDLLLDADSVLNNVQTVVETGEDKAENKPKKIISVMLKQFLEQLPTLKKVQLISLLAEVHESVQEKEIQVFSNDDFAQDKLKEFGWTGGILPTQEEQDYLFVVNSNIQGQKSDAKVTQEIDYQVDVQENGDLYATTKIKRSHAGSPGEQFYGRANINYMRVYVPQGAEIIDAQGFEFPPEEAFHVVEDYYKPDPDLIILEKEVGFHKKSGTRVTNEFGKTAFGNWVIVYPGEEVEVSFTYKLPFKAKMYKEEVEQTFIESLGAKKDLAHKYSLFVQKQSGVTSKLSTKLNYPNDWTPVWKSDNDIMFNNSGYIFKDQLKQDSIIGVVMQKKDK